MKKLLTVMICIVLMLVTPYIADRLDWAILVMNTCVVLLDRLGRPTKFGAAKKEAAKK